MTSSGDERFANLPGEPYEGSSPYVFVSYRHEAWRMVFPVIRWLIEKGQRIWYDEGIEAGSEWRGVIQDHVENCTVFLPFITANYSESQNCRSELSMAHEDGKIIIPIYIEESRLRHGTRTILADRQGIYKYEISSEELFFKRLMSFAALEQTREGDVEEDVKSERELVNADFKRQESEDSNKQSSASSKKANNEASPFSKEKQVINLDTELMNRNMDLAAECIKDWKFGNAMEHYKKAAAAGSAQAMFEIGQMYENGIGVLQSKRDALVWYRKAVAKNPELPEEYQSTDACSKIREYCNEIDDPKEKFSLTLLLAENGDLNSQAQVGKLYEKGVGTEEDPEEALRWFERAALRGNTIAQKGVKRLSFYKDDNR